MKQYTTQEQTTRLLELGFEKPISVTGIVWSEYEKDSPIINANTVEYIRAYSIGELIEILNGVCELEITRDGSGWGVYDELRAFTGEELIDALYKMIVKLKEKGEI